MNERRANPTPDTNRRQQLAASPDASAWVAANAGSGKTHVLTQRVLRLLLSGAAPENILCLTYTKAAAANMRSRVAGRLAEWALMPDNELVAALTGLEERVPTDDAVRRARTLFAYALETPGGLKINTIHAFCEAVLHRFPLEAKVPFDFTVIEDAERGEMIRKAREDVLAAGLDADLTQSDAVHTLFALMSDSAIEEAIAGALGQIRELRPVLVDRAAAKQRLRKLVDLEHPKSYAFMRKKICSETFFTAGFVQKLVKSLNGDPTNNSSLADRAAQLDPFNLHEAKLLNVFFTEKLKPRKRLLLKGEAAAFPDLDEVCQREAERLFALMDELKAEELVERSEALLDVIHAIVSRYEAQKRARSLLDFDDLVERLAALLRNSDEKDWVRYKLDASITHVLVDESQDTNPEQWIVVDELVDEFFDGASAVEHPRTVFGVGDPKQSIFSFQGAEPKLFLDTGAKYKRKADLVGLKLHEIDLPASFRTQEGILSAVDLVFADPMQSHALLRPGGVQHESARADKGGSVTLWPPFEEQAEDPLEEWPIAEQANPPQSAIRQLAETMAATIDDWIGKRALGARERFVTADDVLILVQSRGALFHEIIRALKNKKIATPGADKLPVTGHIAILDLLALADILLNPSDDLGLAALLRSPLFDVSEDDLLALCHDRPGTVWDSLRQSILPTAQEAFERLNRWRNRLDFERPYEFFAQVLYAEGGLKRFHARLGTEVDEVIAEFLDMALAHERNTRPSLQGFLAEMRAADISIKRDLPEHGAGVRVMTVHGAKGLEAPIVFIADAAAKPQGANLRKPVYVLGQPWGPLLLHASSRENHVDKTMALREEDEAKQREEYWRKLYVAMTRAEDELHVFATLNRQRGDRDSKLKDTWYAALESTLGLDAEAKVTDTLADGGHVLIYPKQRPVPKPAKAAISTLAERDEIADFGKVLPKATSRQTITPSTAGHAAPAEDALMTHGEALRDAESARREGIALHALLQHLTRIPETDRLKVAQKAMQQLLPDRVESHQKLIGKALSILSTPELAYLFGSDSRAEVPILAHGMKNGEPVRIAGRIDRLVVQQDRVLIVDFKSDAMPPNDARDVPKAYATQLGLYALVLKKLFPEHQIRTAIFWTTSEKLMELADLEPIAALQEFTLT